MKPIIFNTPMVQAILSGRKTQTRRVIKPQPPEKSALHRYYADDAPRDQLMHSFGWFIPEAGDLWPCNDADRVRCPYGEPGNHLWVREAFIPFEKGHIHYKADYDHDPEGEKAHGIVWRPSIQMPRWASRITLKITDIRVERLRDISEADAKAEGIFTPEIGYANLGSKAPILQFGALWESIHGDGSWDENPWLWVIGFERLEGAAR